MSDKKTASPTISMVKHILMNVNQDKGIWILKVPHQTRKKGSERFRAIRVDFAGSTQGVRVRCKPGGNETCYEYMLMPPAGVDAEVLFEVLSAVHPSTLRTSMGVVSASDEVAIFKGLMDRIKDYPKDISINPSKMIEKKIPHAISEKPSEILISTEAAEVDLNLPQSLGSPRPLLTTEDEPAPNPPAVNPIEEEVRMPEKLAEIASEFNPNPKISALDIVPAHDDEDGRAMLLSNQFVLDRALVAMSFVTEEGFGKRIEVSDSIISNLRISEFLEVSTLYNSIEGAMRAIMMGLCGQDLARRVFHGGNKWRSLQGYSLTPKGEKRLLALRDFLHQDLIVKMSPDWNVADDREQEFDGETFEKTEGAGEPQAAAASEPEVKPKSEFTTDQIVRLESWLSELKEHNERISEIEGLMEDLRSEKEDEMHHLAGVEVAREKALRQREELDRELSRLDSKKSDLEGKVAKKDVEIDEWNAELRAHISNKSRIESDIGSSTGMQRTS